MNCIARLLLIAVLFSGFFQCCPDEVEEEVFSTTPIELEKPETLPSFVFPEHNPPTEEGVALGKALFFDKTLSGDNSMSCATCHQPQNVFATQNKVEVGIQGDIGRRNAMPLFNLLWNNKGFFWDGRAATLEELIPMPVVDPIEMHEEWPNALEEIRGHAPYVQQFKAAFNVGVDAIEKEHVSNAVSQYLYTLISGNSKYDKFLRGEADLTDQELAGLIVFRTEGPLSGEPTGGGDCFHCHVEPLFTDFTFRNNGLDPASDWTDLGRYEVTGASFDKAKFKTPSLRNIALTAPYMHDGRFQTLEEVVAHYESGGHFSPTLDPLMKFTDDGLMLSLEEQEALLAFLKTLTDTSFITQPQ